MAKKTDDLTELRGIGPILAQRLKDAGFGSFAKIAEAGEEQLKTIKGFKKGAAAEVAAEAVLLTESRQRTAKERAAEVKERVGAVREKMIFLAESTLERYSSPKARRRINTDIAQIGDALDRMAEARKGLKRAAKGLLKAEKR